jgi:monothiol glutaredoxin
MNTEEKIHHQLATNAVILYMKGVPTNPQCGFSAKAVTILNSTKIPYAYVNVLEAPFIREKLPKISKWPTFPQLFVKAELVGGCDIIEEMSNNGSLLPLLTSTVEHSDNEDKKDGLSISDIQQMVVAGMSASEVIIEGEGCDLLITVVSDEFADLSPVKKQQMVMAILQEPLTSGRIHALTVKTFTPSQWQEINSAKPEGLLQIKS